MNYSVKTIEVFERQVKRLLKKYPSLKEEMLHIVSTLKVNPQIGTPLGLSCYKIRLSIKSKGKGKSGGARLVTQVLVTDKLVYLLNIYDKSEKDSLSLSELKELIKSIG